MVFVLYGEMECLFVLVCILIFFYSGFNYSSFYLGLFYKMLVLFVFNWECYIYFDLVVIYIEDYNYYEFVIDKEKIFDDEFD